MTVFPNEISIIYPIYLYVDPDLFIKFQNYAIFKRSYIKLSSKLSH